MNRHPDDATAADDLELVGAARREDRLAFGVLYLRHNAAAWRIASVTSRFSPDAELAVIDGFTRVFSALPEESEDFGTGGVTFRPYLLACVRQAALDRARTSGRAEGAGRRARRAARPERPPGPAPPTGLTPGGEVVLASLEHHVARGALAALPERSRAALWLSDVEAMTPTEIAGILGGSAREVADLTSRVRAEVRAHREAALGRHEVRSDCRFTVANLDAFAAGTLDPSKGVLVRSHVDICPPCRMRLGELANAAALAAAVPAAPLLGGEAQRHWLASAGDIRPADRLLPPGVAAASPARRLPGVLQRGGRAAPARGSAGDSIEPTTSSAGRVPPGWTAGPGATPSPTPALPPAWTVPPGRTTPWRRPPGRRTGVLRVLGGGATTEGRAGRAVWPALPAAVLAIAWLGVLVSLPYLMTPATTPGPGGRTLPALQAYLPPHAPGAARSPVEVDEAAPSGAGGLAAGAASTGTKRASAGSSAGEGVGGAAVVQLIPTAPPPPSKAAGHPTVGILGGGISTVAEVVAGAAPTRVDRPTRVHRPTRPAKPTRGIRDRKPAPTRPEVRPARAAKAGGLAELRKPTRVRPGLRARDRDRRPERAVARRDVRRVRPQTGRQDGIFTA